MIKKLTLFFIQTMILIFILFNQNQTVLASNNLTNSVNNLISNSQLLNSLSINSASGSLGDDSDFAAFSEHNLPQPENPSYTDRQLVGLSTTQLAVPIIAENRPSSYNTNSIYLKDFSSSDLSNLTTSNFSIDSSSPLSSSDFTFTYSESTLNITLNNNSLMKTNGSGTQIILNVKNPSGTSAQLTIGIWRNYVIRPYVRLNIGSGMQLQYMFNQDLNNLTPTDGATVNDGSTLEYITPNFNIIDGSKKIQTMYDDANSPLTNLYTADTLHGGYLSDYQGISTVGHNYVFIDPNDNQRIMAQSDYSVTTKSNKTYKFRVYHIMEPTSSGESVQVKMKIVNLSVDSNGKETSLPNDFFIFRNYDTKLNDNDRVPIWFSDLITSGVNIGKPKGLYFSETNISPERYRISFDFSNNGGPFGWSAKTPSTVTFTSTSDPGLNTTSHTPDSSAFSGSDSAVSMLYSPSQVGGLGYGDSTKTLGFTTSASDTYAPMIRTNESEIGYSNNSENTNLPNIDITGIVRDFDSSQVKIYYTIDDPVDSNSDASANSGTLLNTVNLKSSDNTTPSWVNYPGNQTTPSSSQITDQDDLQKLATASSAGHNIYVYGVDNGNSTDPTIRISNIETIKVPATGSLKINYQDTDGNEIQDSKTLFGPVGSSYDKTNTHYFPTTITKSDGEKFDLEELPSNVDGTIASGTNEVTLKYARETTVSIQSSPDLDYGSMNSGNDSLIHIKKESNSLVILDTTKNPDWKLSLSASNLVSSTNTLSNVIKYVTLSGQEVNINNDNQIVASYNNNDGASVNLDKYWWKDADTKQGQVSGPMLRFPVGVAIPSGKYTSTLTWNLEDSLD